MKHLETLLDRLKDYFDAFAGDSSFYMISVEKSTPPLSLPTDVELPAIWRRRSPALSLRLG